jgi:hypothetical protein
LVALPFGRENLPNALLRDISFFRSAPSILSGVRSSWSRSPSIGSSATPFWNATLRSFEAPLRSCPAFDRLGRAPLRSGESPHGSSAPHFVLEKLPFVLVGVPFDRELRHSVLARGETECAPAFRLGGSIRASGR